MISRRSTVALFLTALLPGFAAVSSHADGDVDNSGWMSRVLKIVVTRADNTREFGSAVSIGGERMVTNCHVIRGASRIEVKLPGENLLAQTDLRDAYRDLCFLFVPGYNTEPVQMIDIGQTRVGLKVVAVGYPAGGLAVSDGKIVGLHTCECDGGKVIQTSAAFDRGASGGGLFDQEGRLVGILSFKSTSGGNFHFALPVGWIRHMMDHPVALIGEGNTFWEKPGTGSAYFLAACDLGAKENWPSLSRLASEWSKQEPNNPEAWMALGRARLGLRQADAAVIAYQRALMLDSTRDEAKWALQQLELELGKSLVDVDGI